MINVSINGLISCFQIEYSSDVSSFADAEAEEEKRINLSSKDEKRTELIRECDDGRVAVEDVSAEDFCRLDDADGGFKSVESDESVERVDSWDRG